MKVLVADDSMPIRERLVDRLLQIQDVTVTEASDTDEALSGVQSFTPDVAILDIRMPGGGGIKALGEIKRMKPETTVMIMTNYPYAQYRKKCLDAGADFFFDKSTEFEQISETVGRLAGGADLKAIAHRTAAAQLVTAKEELERATQRKVDMGILSRLCKPALSGLGSAYEMWEKTFDAMPDMVAIFDANHTIIRANRAMADRLNVPASELSGKKCYEYMHGTNFPANGCPHVALLKDHTEHVTELYDEHLGSWLEVSVSPVFEKTQLIGVIHIARDITARKQAEAIAQSTLNALSDHIAIVDEAGEILYVNQSWETFAHQNELLVGEGVGKNYLAVCDKAYGLHADEAYRFAEGIRAVLRGEFEFFEMEYPCETKTEIFWFCGRVTPFPGEGPRRVVISHENITDRKLAESAVKQSEENLRHVIQTVRDGLWDWDILHDKVTCSPQWHQMIGYEPNEFPVSYKKFEELMNPEDVPKVKEAVRAYFCGETERYNVEFRLRHKDGSWVWIWARGTLIERSSSGEPSRMMGTHADMTARRNTEQALRESELRYRQLFESMQAGFALHEIICDENGTPCDYRFLEVNPAFETLTGLKAEAVVGRTIKEVIPVTEAFWIETYGKVALTGQPARIEDFSETLGRHYSVSAYCPNPGQFATIFTDITDRKRTEQRLAEQEKYYRTLFAASMDSLFIADAQTGQILDVNRQAEKLIGRSRKDLLQMNQSDLHPDPDAAHKIFQKHVQEADESPKLRMNKVLHRDGTVIPVEIKVGRAEIGTRTVAIGSFHDLRGRIAAEQALRESEARLTAATKAAGIGVWDRDIVHDVLTWDDRMFELYGVNRDDFCGAYESWKKGIHPDDLERVLAEVTAAERGGKPFDTEFRIVHPDGGLRHIRAFAQVLRDDDGTPLRMIGVNFDITDRKKAEERIRDLVNYQEGIREEDRKWISRELHDDIGQVLTALKIDLVMLKNDCTCENETKEKMEDMQKLLTEGIQIIHSLCNRLRPGALDALGVEEALFDLVGEWRQRNNVACDLFVDVNEESLSGAVKTAVFRIVQEALTNVSRYADASKVEIHLVSDDSALQISIYDNGCGMSPGAENKPTSFGLLGMRERIEALDGNLCIESALGKGTRIEGSVPLMTASCAT